MVGQQTNSPIPLATPCRGGGIAYADGKSPWSGKVMAKLKRSCWAQKSPWCLQAGLAIAGHRWLPGLWPAQLSHSEELRQPRRSCSRCVCRLWLASGTSRSLQWQSHSPGSGSGQDPRTQTASRTARTLLQADFIPGGNFPQHPTPLGREPRPVQLLPPWGWALSNGLSQRAQLEPCYFPRQQVPPQPRPHGPGSG